MEYLNKIIQGNCLEKLKMLPDKSIHCCVTSPPYFGLRDYGHKEQIGAEHTPQQYVAVLVEVFEEVKRVLRDDGTLWLNLGDSYAGSGKGNNLDGTPHPFKLSAKKGTQKGTVEGLQIPNKASTIGLKSKDLIGIPWMVAFALRDAGWYLRQDIIWHKPNPMPESVTDRCTKAHEYIFLLSKSRQYYYDADAIKTEVKDATVQRMLQAIDNQKGSDRVPGKTNGNQGSNNVIPPYSLKNRKGKDVDNSAAINGNGVKGHSGNYRPDGTLIGGGLANKKSVWTVPTKGYKECHFATFPPELIVDCIKAGCPRGGVVLDPFMGSGTMAMVSSKLDRNFVGIELNQKYIDIANKRLNKELGLFRK